MAKRGTPVSVGRKPKGGARRRERKETEAMKKRRLALTGKTMMVRVLEDEVGYYAHLRRRAGDVFMLEDTSHFSEMWMEEVPMETAEQTSTAQQAVNKKHDEILGAVHDAQQGPQPEPEAPTGAQEVLTGGK